MVTHNGEKFLDAQLQSIQQQRQIKSEVLIYDCGSTDRTREILQAWQEKGLVVDICFGNNIGPDEAFWKLLLTKKSMHNYIFFSDQDDVWNLEKCWKMIENQKLTRSQVVFCSRDFMDAWGNRIEMKDKVVRKVCWENSLIENVAYANCTMITSNFRKSLFTFVKPKEFYFDSWLYLVASLSTSISYIPTPLVQYRLHTENLIGMPRIYSFARLFSSLRRYASQVESIEVYSASTLNTFDKFRLVAFQSAWKEPSVINLIRCLLLNPSVRQKKWQTVFFKIVYPAFALYERRFSKRHLRNSFK
jgi:glycosyltransferase involved in cell wall biosynthesis